MTWGQFALQVLMPRMAEVGVGPGDPVDVPGLLHAASLCIDAATHLHCGNPLEAIVPAAAAEAAPLEPDPPLDTGF